MLNITNFRIYEFEEYSGYVRFHPVVRDVLRTDCLRFCTFCAPWRFFFYRMKPRSSTCGHCDMRVMASSDIMYLSI